MGNLRILIIEDDDRWGAAIGDLLSPFGGQTQVAPNHEQALRLIRRVQFDIVVTDLALPGSAVSAAPGVEQGFHLLKELRNSTLNETSALLVVSGQMKNNDVSEAMRLYKVHQFFDKIDFDKHLFVSAANDALLLARIKRANKKQDRASRLQIHFDQDRILGSILEGSVQRPFHQSPHTARLEVAKFVRRANNMNLLVKKGPKVWRPEAQALGKELYEILYHDRSILEGLAATPNPKDLWLQFSGPPEGLGVPFELLHDGQDYLTFKHVLTRGVAGPGNSIKRVKFQKFIRSFLGQQVPLRILMVAVDDANNPGAYTMHEETELLEGIFNDELKCLGIRAEVERISGKDATRDNIGEALQRGGYHFFHYSGHGYFQSDQPESSRIMTADTDRSKSFLTASDLTDFCQGTELRFTYLSCCLGACSAPKIEHGDFFGLFDALARADVPMVLGYRWEMGDALALSLASAFYKKLWLTLSPGEALFEARKDISHGEESRDSESWAAPVLLMQNG